MENNELTQEDIELGKATEKIAQYIHKHKIKTIIAIGISAQPAAFLLKQVWAKHPEYGVIPKIISLGTRVPFYEKWSNRLPLGTSVLEDKDIQTIVEKRISHLVTSKKINPNEPILLLEEYIASGRTTKRFTEALRKIGFKNIKIGCLSRSIMSRESGVKIDVYGTEEILPWFYQKRRQAIFSFLKSRNNNQKTYQIERKNILNNLSEMREKLRKIAAKSTKK